jgi:hypothetical protein
MSRYFVIEPEVAGGLGERTEMDRSVHPPKVSRLHYQFDGWLGDGLLESFPCFIVSENVATALGNLNATGYRLADLEVSRSEQFEELYPGRELPEFRWLQANGRPGVDDLGVSADHRLVASERVLEALRSLGLKHFEASQFK